MSGHLGGFNEKNFTADRRPGEPNGNAKIDNALRKLGNKRGRPKVI